MTAERIARAKNLKMIVTAGIGSDHTDLQAAIDARHHRRRGHLLQLDHVAEHVVMMILVAGPQLSALAPGGARRRLEHRRLRGALLRRRGHACRHGRGGADRARVLRRLKPFDMHLHYYDRHRLPAEVEQELGLIWHDSVEDMVGVCDVVTINCPLHPGDRESVRRGDDRRG